MNIEIFINQNADDVESFPADLAHCFDLISYKIKKIEIKKGEYFKNFRKADQVPQLNIQTEIKKGKELSDIDFMHDLQKKYHSYFIEFNNGKEVLISNSNCIVFFDFKIDCPVERIIDVFKPRKYFWGLNVFNPVDKFYYYQDSNYKFELDCFYSFRPSYIVYLSVNISLIIKNYDDLSNKLLGIKNLKRDEFGIFLNLFEDYNDISDRKDLFSFLPSDIIVKKIKSKNLEIQNTFLRSVLNQENLNSYLDWLQNSEIEKKGYRKNEDKEFKYFWISNEGEVVSKKDAVLCLFMYLLSNHTVSTKIFSKEEASKLISYDLRVLNDRIH